MHRTPVPTSPGRTQHPAKRQQLESHGRGLATPRTLMLLKDYGKEGQR